MFSVFEGLDLFSSGAVQRNHTGPYSVAFSKTSSISAATS